MTRDDWVADDAGQSGGERRKAIRWWTTREPLGCGQHNERGERMKQDNQAENDSKRGRGG